ncbi:MAG: protein kinase domain-containing protein [Lachnospiraceae bacterium]
MKLCYHCMSQISNDKAATCPVCGKSLDPEEQKPRFLKPGTVLGGKFIAGYHLGSGGFGNTYIGWDQVLQRKVAIKEFYPEQYCGRGQDGLTVVVADERLISRYQRGLQQFLVEARNVAALHDVQGVVEISNFFEENGTGYIIMEYLEGMDVKTILQKSGNKKDYEWSRRVILTVLYTLKEVHKRGVLHRDIAPDNIFVTKEGIVKLIDFGAAKNVTVMDSSKDVWLKAGYAPIEQYRNTFEQGPYTDLYAVAALFYRMLTGQKPVPAVDRLENDPLVPLSDMGISIPQQAEMAIMVCLNIMPEYRLQSAEEFMEALDGKFFIPVYEPTWILPKEKPKGIKAKIGALPVGAKVAICLLGIALIGGTGIGVMSAFNNQTQTSMENVQQVLMVDLKGKTREEANKEIEKLSQDYGWDLKVDTSLTVFDPSKEVGTVSEQSIPAGTVLYDAAEDVEQQSKAGNLTYTNDGLHTQVSGTIKLTLYSRTVRYRELKGLDAYTIAKKMGINTKDKKRFIPKESGGKKYYDLLSLQIGSEKVTSGEINKAENRYKTFEYSDDLKIYYYVTDFFYWKQLPDFTGYQRVDMIPKQQLYRYSDENKKKKVGKKSIERSSFLDKNYYTLKGVHEVNDIVGQNVAAGKKYDESNPGGTILKIKVIGKVFDYEGKTAEEFIEELEAENFYYYGIRTESDEGGDLSWKISKVTMHFPTWDENGKMAEGADPLDFVSGDDRIRVYFDIVVKEPEKETPSTSAPSNRSSGSYSAPSSGYDNSGSYSVPSSKIVAVTDGLIMVIR